MEFKVHSHLHKLAPIPLHSWITELVSGPVSVPLAPTHPSDFLWALSEPPNQVSLSSTLPLTHSHRSLP